MTEEVEVLLVEDNSSDAEMTIRALRQYNLGNRLFRVENGAEALDFIFAEGKYAGGKIASKLKFIMLDLKLPKVNGKDVLSKIKSNEKTKKIPVIMLTSSKEDPDIKKCYELGANGFVVKPVEFDAFHKAIFELGLYWLTINQPAQ